MRKTGYYWVQFHDYGSVRAVLWKNRAWRYDERVTEADLTVVSGPIPIPSPEEISSHNTRLATIVQDDWQLVGCDPRRDGRHVDGVYWAKWPGHRPCLVQLYETGWWELEWYDGAPVWEMGVEDAECPPIIFGPLDQPLGRHRISEFAQGLIDTWNAEQRAQVELEQAAAELKIARSSLH